MSLNLDIPDCPRLRDTLAALCLLVLCIVSGVAGYWIGSGNAPVRESTAPAPAVRQHDGSLIAARAPDSKPPPAPHTLPSGATEIRRITSTIKPPDCAPIHVTTSLVAIDDGIRAIVSTDNGEVIDSVDTPIRPMVMTQTLKWSVIGSVDAVDRKKWSVSLNRDFGRLVLGGAIRTDERGNAHPWLNVGFRFKF